MYFAGYGIYRGELVVFSVNKLCKQNRAPGGTRPSLRCDFAGILRGFSHGVIEFGERVSIGRIVNYKGLTPKIINGTNAKPGEIPYQVSLQAYDFHYCGGSILNKNYVVTAAHCVLGEDPNAFTVLVGSVNRTKPLATYQVTKFIPHKSFNFSHTQHDIALIKVQPPFNFSKYVSPVPLVQSKEKIPAKTVAIVSGWGSVGGKESGAPEILQKAQIYIADQNYCSEVMQAMKLEIYSTNICANDPNTRRGQCNGDSGGPLTVNGKLAGIVSWSYKDPFCASTKFPGVYTRVSEYIDWIKQNAV